MCKKIHTHSFANWFLLLQPPSMLLCATCHHLSFSFKMCPLTFRTKLAPTPFQTTCQIVGTGPLFSSSFILGLGNKPSSMTSDRYYTILVGMIPPRGLNHWYHSVSNPPKHLKITIVYYTTTQQC